MRLVITTHPSEEEEIKMTYEELEELLRRLRQCFVEREGWYLHNSQSGWIEVSEDLRDILEELFDEHSRY